MTNSSEQQKGHVYMGSLYGKLIQTIPVQLMWIFSHSVLAELHIPFQRGPKANRLPSPSRCLSINNWSCLRAIKWILCFPYICWSQALNSIPSGTGCAHVTANAHTNHIHFRLTTRHKVLRLGKTIYI